MEGDHTPTGVYFANTTSLVSLEDIASISTIPNLSAKGNPSEDPSIKTPANLQPRILTPTFSPPFPKPKPRQPPSSSKPPKQSGPGISLDSFPRAKDVENVVPNI